MLKKQKSIAIIICYFGKFPWYFDYFIHSCRSNPTIDFFIFSDNIISNCPENVKLTYYTLSDFNTTASEKLGFSVNIKKAYKLCDFKPTYGLLFSQYIQDYDFWGMSDIDIIFGRIREFMTDELLEEYDIINTRHDYLTGSFLLFRNNQKINTLFTKSRDYKKVFTSDTHFCFDECNFKHWQLNSELDIFDIPCEIESMEHVIKRESLRKEVNVFYDFIIIDGLVGNLKWNNGILTYKNRFEILLYHLIQYKTNYYTKKKVWKRIPSIFYLDKYIFRKHSTMSFYGLLEYFVYGKIFILKPIIIHWLDFNISNLFNIYVNNLTEGTYKNKLGEASFNIKRNSGQLDQFFIDQGSLRVGVLVKSLFHKKSFFVKAQPRVRYRYFKLPNDFIEKIDVIQVDGNASAYEFCENRVHFENVFLPI